MSGSDHALGNPQDFFNPLPGWMLASTVDVRIEMEAFEGDEVLYYSQD